MINKLTVTAALAIVASFGVPQIASAQTNSNTQKKIQRLFQKLRALPNGNSPRARVRGLSGRLVALDVRRAVKYYRIAVRKFPVEAGLAQNARQLRTTFDRVINRSSNRGLIPANLGRRLDRQIAKIQQNTQDPTPTPYQAFVITRSFVTA